MSAELQPRRRISVSEPDLGTLEEERVAAVMARGWITQGQEVAEFEQRFAQFLDVPPSHVVACSSGTSALHLALLASGIGPGDEVIVPDLTYVATANAVMYCGATPVLVDVDPLTWTLDLAAAHHAVSKRTRAILPVHLYGVPCDMDSVREFASVYNLTVIEDAAEAIGGMFDSRPCGTLGHAAAFSFYGNKVITTGEGGAVVAATEHLALRVRHLRGQAMSREHRFFHDDIGYNYRMTDLQAAVGNAQLARVDALLVARQQVVEVYKKSLLGISPFLYPIEDRIIAPWMFTLIPRNGAGRRNDLMHQLQALGIETRPAFVPLHRMPMYEEAAHRFPNANIIGDCGISLPTHPLMTQEDAAFVSSSLMELTA
jgi:perosamine synthetase